jgi:hypothetical protein
MKNNYYQNRMLYLIALIVVLLPGCKNGKVTITISPQTATVELGLTQQFQATVAPSNAQVFWTVDEGDAWGTVMQNGLYIAPDLLPSPSVATVRVSSISDPSVSATAKVTITEGGGSGTTTTTPGGGGTGGGIGAACGVCAPGLTCITDAPGGYCTKTCSRNSDCGQAAFCYQIQDEQGQPQALCLAACSTNADCRAGYTCQGDPGATVCFPGGSSGTTTVPGGGGGYTNADLNGCYGKQTDPEMFKYQFDGAGKFCWITWNSLSGEASYGGQYQVSGSQLLLAYSDGTNETHSLYISADKSSIQIDGTNYMTGVSCDCF